ncbi:hypothetical protein SISNIDRAFT_456201 [Sistotremastrum niveocremeum HHB9708]|uniref:Uncharacterized protein n=1 Tax=Sistotremastrum niveocremeum HHB9708 TaxID=1314777 RepID=A0A164T1Y9_9AGAM|nr:hypothetical protein SISNIDRAFT_456201 [Sistotremastrum niveocremeum HHB9708]
MMVERVGRAKAMTNDDPFISKAVDHTVQASSSFLRQPDAVVQNSQPCIPDASTITATFPPSGKDNSPVPLMPGDIPQSDIALRDRRGGLDALERKLLGEVGTQRIKLDHQRPTSLADLGFSTSSLAPQASMDQPTMSRRSSPTLRPPGHASAIYGEALPDGRESAPFAESSPLQGSGFTDLETASFRHPVPRSVIPEGIAYHDRAPVDGGKLLEPKPIRLQMRKFNAENLRLPEDSENKHPIYSGKVDGCATITSTPSTWASPSSPTSPQVRSYGTGSSATKRSPIKTVNPNLSPDRPTNENKSYSGGGSPHQPAKVTSSPAVLSESYATPVLSYAAGVDSYSLSPRMSKPNSTVRGLFGESVEQVTSPASELTFGKAKLQDLIKRYQT